MTNVSWRHSVCFCKIDMYKMPTSAAAKFSHFPSSVLFSGAHLAPLPYLSRSLRHRFCGLLRLRTVLRMHPRALARIIRERERETEKAASEARVTSCGIPKLSRDNHGLRK